MNQLKQANKQGLHLIATKKVQNYIANCNPKSRNLQIKLQKIVKNVHNP